MGDIHSYACPYSYSYINIDIKQYHLVNLIAGSKPIVNELNNEKVSALSILMVLFNYTCLFIYIPVS